jgi:predicted transcriptional regulator
MNIFFIISIICLALCFIMFFYLKWYIKNRAFASEIEEHRTEAAKLIVDINSVTDRNLQLVEDSISKLKKILEETKERTEEYRNAIEIKPAKEPLYTSLGRGIRFALINPEKLPPPPLRQLSLDIRSPDELHAPSVKSESKTSQAAPPVQKPPSKKQIRGAIDLLANEGLSPEEIASRLDISIAQVNLAMNLRRTKRQ